MTSRLPKKTLDAHLVCSTGTCTAGGIHSSSIWNKNATYNYALGHFGLQSDTTSKQLLALYLLLHQLIQITNRRSKQI